VTTTGHFLLDPTGTARRRSTTADCAAGIIDHLDPRQHRLVLARARTPTEGLHLAFSSNDDADVQRFHQVATGAAYRSNGPPGERPRYHPGYYATYVLDADGNNVEVVSHHRP
jgi:catechol 2,3-dioxygenase-like lactoylglutathione lyase family enzyme